MRKIVLAGAAMAIALSLAPSHAEPGHGCQAVGAEQGDSFSCDYTANGPATWVAATPNSWTITVVRQVDGVPTEVERVESDSLQPPSTGELETEEGDTVTITVGPDSAEVVEGSIGIVAAFETE